jgi:phosphotransferase system  glucose/maltose/N-acetylglucosamine-specific IIC component
MNYKIPLILLISVMIYPAFAQEQSNSSLSMVNLDIDYNNFNKPARDQIIIPFQDIHDVSWQVNLVNELMYGNPNGNGVIRFYDATIEDKFIEIGMGSPPNKKFWIAAQLPDEGYVVIHNKLERGWLPGAKVILAYSDTAGLTVNNGERIVLSNLDIEGFKIKAYSVWGMEASQDPPAVTAGYLNLEILSGDPKEGSLHMFPFMLVGCLGIGVAILLVTKKRS